MKIDLNTISYINKIICELYNQSSLIINKNNIESALSPLSFDYDDKYTQATKVFRNLIIAHGFQDANKRTACIALTFLVQPQCTHSELVNCALDVATGKYTQDVSELVKRLYPHIELNEDLEVMEGPTQEEYGISSIINQAIKDTFSLIDTYNSYSINCRDQGFEDIANKFNELNTELNSHIGTLQNMLKEVSPNAEAIDGISEEEVFEVEETAKEELDEGIFGDIAKTAWSGIKNIKAVKDTSSAIKNIKKQIQDSPSYQAAKKTWQQTETGKKQQAEREVKQLEDTKNKLYQDIDKLSNKEEVKKILPQIRAYIQNDNVSEEDAENIISVLQNKGKSLGVNVKTRVDDKD